MNNLCPVCGYDFKEPIEDSMICVCCGTQYGYHDSIFSHAHLRNNWLSNGAKWHSHRILPPVGWNPELQMMYAGLCLFTATMYVKTLAHIERVEVATKPGNEWDQEPTSITYYSYDWPSPQNSFRRNVNLTSIAA